MKFMISNCIIPMMNGEPCIGSKVLDKEAFLKALEVAVSGHDPKKDRAPGQHYIILSREVFPMLSSGEGKRVNTKDEDYVVRTNWDGYKKAFLKRELAQPVSFAAAVVYTAEAYALDKDVKDDPAELKRLEEEKPTHVLVTVKATAAPSSPRDPRTIVKGIAGHNNDYSFMRSRGKPGAGMYRFKVDASYVDGIDKVVAECEESERWDNEWCVVADPILPPPPPEERQIVV